jgi:hypothetical protein
MIPGPDGHKKKYRRTELEISFAKTRRHDIPYHLALIQTCDFGLDPVRFPLRMIYFVRICRSMSDFYGYRLTLDILLHLLLVVL